MKRKGKHRIVLQNENYVNLFLEREIKRGNRREYTTKQTICIQNIVVFKNFFRHILTKEKINGRIREKRVKNFPSLFPLFFFHNKRKRKEEEKNTFLSI